MRQRPTKMNRLGLSAMLVVFAIEAAWMSPLGAQQQPLMVPSGADYYEILDLNAKFCHGLDIGANDGQICSRTRLLRTARLSMATARSPKAARRSPR